jgi:exodeoxyribonuclease VIII
MSNHDYHRSPGISKSALDLVAVSPSYYKWAMDAPRDDSKTAALDEGTAIHMLLLEPEKFADEFVVAPEVDRRTKDGKAEWVEFCAEVEGSGNRVLDSDTMRRLTMMRESVMAHPMARWIFEQDGRNESSIFWTDPETGRQCKCRPDRYIWVDDQPIIVDVKKTAAFDKFHYSVRDYRYHVQQAMYCDGFEKHFGVKPKFWFLRVSSTIELGRYPVSVDDLADEFMVDHDMPWGNVLGGHSLYRRDLQTYHDCREQNDWLHVGTITPRKY